MKCLFYFYFFIKYFKINLRDYSFFIEIELIALVYIALYSVPIHVFLSNFRVHHCVCVVDTCIVIRVIQVNYIMYSGTIKTIVVQNIKIYPNPT